MKLKCSHDLCIYWEENHCILDFISISSIGMCEECINIFFEEEDLNRRRQELRKMFEEIKAILTIQAAAKQTRRETVPNRRRRSRKKRLRRDLETKKIN